MESDRPQNGSWDSLGAALLGVVKGLTGQPLLLTAMGVAVVLALIAIFGPAGGQLYAGIVAALVLVLAVLWAVTHRSSDERSEGNVIRTGSRAEVDDVEMRRKGAANVIDAGRRSRVSKIRMSSDAGDERQQGQDGP